MASGTSEISSFRPTRCCLRRTYAAVGRCCVAVTALIVCLRVVAAAPLGVHGAGVDSFPARVPPPWLQRSTTPTTSAQQTNSASHAQPKRRIERQPKRRIEPQATRGNDSPPNRGNDRPPVRNSRATMARLMLADAFQWAQRGWHVPAERLVQRAMTQSSEASGDQRAADAILGKRPSPPLPSRETRQDGSSIRPPAIDPKLMRLPAPTNVSGHLHQPKDSRRPEHRRTSVQFAAAEDVTTPLRAARTETPKNMGLQVSESAIQLDVGSRTDPSEKPVAGQNLPRAPRAANHSDAPGPTRPHSLSLPAVATAHVPSISMASSWPPFSVHSAAGFLTGVLMCLIVLAVVFILLLARYLVRLETMLRGAHFAAPGHAIATPWQLSPAAAGDATDGRAGLSTHAAEQTNSVQIRPPLRTSAWHDVDPVISEEQQTQSKEDAILRRVFQDNIELCEKLSQQEQVAA